MVEISLYGSGEGPGWVTAPGYSTAGNLRRVRVWALCQTPTGSPWRALQGSNPTPWDKARVMSATYETDLARATNGW
jgi:hypothetical protein